MKNEWHKLKVAVNGLILFFRTEHHGMLHLLALIVVTCAGFYFSISPYEWIAVVICFALVITAEALNTAIEKLGDFVHKEKHEHMRIIKDIAAGGVLFSAIVAIVVACIIFIPKIF